MIFFIISNFAKAFTYVSDQTSACQKYPLNHSGCHPHTYTKGKKTMYLPTSTISTASNNCSNNITDYRLHGRAVEILLMF